MRVEHRPMRRLEEVAPGTRVVLAPGRVGTLLEVNFTRAVVELECGEHRRRDVAPGCEVQVLAPDVLAPATEARPGAAEMRNADPRRPVSPTASSDPPGSPPAHGRQSV